MQKARRHTPKVLRPLVSTQFQGLFQPPIRSTFHLSLTVLVHYRSLNAYLALPVGPGEFIQDFSCLGLLRIPLDPFIISDTGLSPPLV